MLVNINGVWHDSEIHPILIKFSKQEKDHIANMHPEAFNYVSFPDIMSYDEVKQKLKIDDKANPLR